MAVSCFVLCTCYFNVNCTFVIVLITAYLLSYNPLYKQVSYDELPLVFVPLVQTMNTNLQQECLQVVMEIRSKIENPTRSCDLVQILALRVYGLLCLFLSLHSNHTQS